MKFILILASLMLAVSASAESFNSSSVLIYDLTERKSVVDYNADKESSIASVTKLMTVLVILESKLPLHEIITIPRTNDRSPRLVPGMRLSRVDAVQLALVASDNRAAKALATSYPGGERQFVAAMNQTAKQLGMENTYYAEPTGIMATNRATAHDLVKLLEYANNNEVIRSFSQVDVSVVNVGVRKKRQQNKTVMFGNTNPLVYESNNIVVSKTGYTTAAGRCAVMVVDKDDKSYAIVLLKAPSLYKRTQDSRQALAIIDSMSKPVLM